MRTFSLRWFLPILLLVTACEGEPQAPPSANTTISGGQPGESPVNAMPVVIGPNGLHSR
jgi:hypothetical protein